MSDYELETRKHTSAWKMSPTSGVFIQMYSNVRYFVDYKIIVSSLCFFCQSQRVLNVMTCHGLLWLNKRFREKEKKITNASKKLKSIFIHFLFLLINSTEK
jgi:hypothetical protein